MRRRPCLESISIQLFYSNIQLRIRNSIGINPHDTSIHAAEPSFPNHQSSTKPSGRRFELREGEDSQIISPSLSQEVMEGNGVGEVPGIKLELRAADVSAAGSDAERASPGDLRTPGNNAVFLLPSLTVGEMEALHFSNGLLHLERIKKIFSGLERDGRKEKERVKCKEDEPTLNVNVEILLEN